MKKNNKFTYIWVTGLFSFLLVILLMVIDYKVNYEDAVIYKYLYFYDCSNSLCSTTNFDDIEDKSTLYSVYKYLDELPTYQELGSEYIAIDNKVLYNYIRGESIANNHHDYQLVSLGDITLFIAKSTADTYSIIDTDGIIKYSDYQNITNYDRVLLLIKDNNITISDLNFQSLNEETISYSENTTITYQDNIINIVNTDRTYKFNTSTLEWID